MAQFPYKGLRCANSIRILRLKPSKSFEDVLQGTFIISQVHKATVYEAVSHTWGVPDFKEAIYVDRKRLRITQNLATALRHFRCTKIPRLLWIDAICIDQSNEHEKNQQVAMMAQIFNRAKRVLAWLGESPKDTTNAIKHFHDLAERAHLYGFLPSLPHRLPSSEFRQKLELLPESTAKDIVQIVKTTNMHYLYRHEWFTRVWVVQEMTLAKGLILCHGRSAIDWEKFATASVLIRAAQQKVTDSPIEFEPLQLVLDLVKARGTKDTFKFA